MIYNWLYFSDSARYLNELAGIRPATAPTYLDFLDDYRSWYFDGSAPEKGQAFMILRTDAAGENVAIGTLQYSAWHLQEGIAELDMWMRSEADCGHGFGSQAITLLLESLRERGFRRVMIRPSVKNARAIGAYAKAGFGPMVLDPESVYQAEYREQFAGGDYGPGGDQPMERWL